MNGVYNTSRALRVDAQAVVAAGSLLVIATDVVQAPNDKQQLEPMLGTIADLPAALGRVDELLRITVISARVT